METPGRPMEYVVVCLCVGVAVLIGGCGSEETSARDSAEETARAYQEAFIEGDGQAVCALLTGEAKRDLVAGFAALGGEPDCAAAMERVIGLAGADELAQLEDAQAELDASDVTIEGRKATVDLPTGELQLERAGEGWYVSDTSTRTVIDEDKTARELAKNLESAGLRAAKVVCPEGVEVQPDKKFKCRVSLNNGAEETATLRILNEDADVEVISLTPAR